MENVLQVIPKPLSDFFVVTVFSLIIGLMQKQLHRVKEDKTVFGTDRTFTFIGILGYLLLISDLTNKILFIFGGVALIVLLGIFYYNRIKLQNEFGITTIVVALLTYCLPLLVLTQPFWLYLMVFVVIIILTELKDTLTNFSEKFDKDEILTLGKFLIIAGVILPIVPDKPIVDFLKITPYKIWLAMVVISSISYLSYILQKFVFKKTSYIFTGILGGLYSSTATTVVLARKSKFADNQFNRIAASIMFATMMMYLRILVLVFIFNPELGRYMAPFLGIMVLISGITGLIIYFIKRSKEVDVTNNTVTRSHPLELRIALIFTVLFVVIAFAIHYVMQQFGNSGLSVLSYLVGIADIDPFLLNLFQGHYDITIPLIAKFSFHAIISNNFVKMIYGIALSDRRTWKWTIIGFVVIIVINFGLLLFM